MEVCAIASARATTGGPSFELRTPTRNASFHRRTRSPPGWTGRALDASFGNASDAAPAPAATRNWRRESDCSRDLPEWVFDPTRNPSSGPSGEPEEDPLECLVR